MQKYDVYRRGFGLVGTFTAKQIEQKWYIAQEDLEWSIENDGLCDFEGEFGEELSAVEEGDEEPVWG